MSEEAPRLERVCATATLDELLAALREEARAQGHRHIERLVSDWREGSNRFDAPGEALFVARDPSSERIVAVGGLNRDPFKPDLRAGRIRRLYVMLPARGQGLGRALVTQLEALAQTSFDVLGVHAHAEEARMFYDRLGFRRTPDDPHWSHRKELRGTP